MICIIDQLVGQTSKEEFAFIGRLSRFVATAQVETANVEQVFIIPADGINGEERVIHRTHLM